MDKAQLLDYFSKIDRYLAAEAVICVYGGAAFIMLDEDGRSSIDIDIAAPYSNASFDDIDQSDIRFLATQSGIPSEKVLEAVDRLPDTFKNDPLVRDNLSNLLTDWSLWATQA